MHCDCTSVKSVTNCKPVDVNLKKENAVSVFHYKPENVDSKCLCVITYNMHFQAVSGAAVTLAGRGRGDLVGRAAATEGGGGGSGSGAGGGGGAEGRRGPGPDAEQGPLSAAGHGGATVSD